MKKANLFLIILTLLVFAQVATAATWHTANQITVAWDAVTTNAAGGTIPAEQISYTVYLCDAITDGSCAAPSELGSTAETTYLITLSAEGRYYFGIKAVRTVDGEKVGESAITWSSDPAYDIGLQYYLPPAVVSGLAIQ